MSLPPLASFPPASLQRHIVSEEWELCLDSWLLLTQRYLLLPSTTFAAQVVEGSSLVDFLTSYVRVVSPGHHNPSAKSRSLRKNSFLLAHRAFKEVEDVSPTLLEWQFLSRLSKVFSKIQTLRDILPAIWHQHKLGESASMRKSKLLLTSMMEDAHVGSLSEERLAQEMAFSRACYPYAQFLMVGSDFLDSLVLAYDRVTLPSLRKHLVALTYVCLASLMSEQESRTSALFDHLYSLKLSHLAKALIESTPFLVKFRTHISGHEKEPGRAKPLLEEFAKHGNQPKLKNPIRRRVDKGKHKASNEYGHGISGDMHVHKLSLVTQVQDLFPDLGSGFIIKLLDEYNDDTENITAHLLEDSLPPHLKQANHSENFDFSSAAYTEQKHDLARNLTPHSTPPLPPLRRNIHDNDDFDNLAIDASKLHLGRKNKNMSADRLLSSDRPSNQKAAILSALAAFDSDDDERDDTYDAEDVGGMVDNALVDEEVDVEDDKNDEALFNAYRMSPELFKRDWDTRRGQPRQMLKRETGMTDEAVEGWAIMLSRDPKRLMQLERVREIGSSSQQSVLEATAWRANSGAEDAESSDAGGPHARGRGRGGRAGPRRRGGRGGGSVAGPASEKDTQVARQRKDVNKGSRANHNRRDQRARKMARGGFAG